MKTHQSGSVLAISLALLTAITLIAMISLQRSGLQTKIVANILHQEKAFNASQNEQEFWHTQYANNPTEHILNIVNEVDAAGLPTAFNLTVSTDHGLHSPLDVSASATYILPDADDITLAVGEETGSRRLYKFMLDSSTSFANRPTLISAQRSGFSFPGLNISQNSF